METKIEKIHPLSETDAAVMTGLRQFVGPMKGKLQGVAAREPFDGIVGRVATPEGVNYRQDTVAGVSGWWVLSPTAKTDRAILYIHGGWFSWGTAQAYRNLVGQIVAKSGVNAFVPDYALAPERPFPEGVNDVQAVYRGLVESGIQQIMLVGDSAGGNLVLGLLSAVRSEALVGAVALSPVTDLALTGASFDSRAEAEPYFTRPQVEALVQAYLGGANPNNPLASPLYGDLAGLPPVRIHVGEDEVLLDDARRYAAKAAAAGVDVQLDIWQGMAHGFLNSVGTLSAADRALAAIGEFVRSRVI